MPMWRLQPRQQIECRAFMSGASVPMDEGNGAPLGLLVAFMVTGTDWNMTC